MTTEAVLVEARPPGLLEVREGLSRDRVVGARRRPLQRVVVDRVDGARNGLADGGVARPHVLVADGGADSLLAAEKFAEAISFVGKWIPRAVAALGSNQEHTLDLRQIHARALYLNKCASREDLIEALVILEDNSAKILRTFGPLHPFTRQGQAYVEDVRMRCEDADAGARPPRLHS